jgi:hypothetical protein
LSHRYDGDDTTNKEPVVVPAMPSVPEPSNAPGYGEEPVVEHDPTSFETEMKVDPDLPADGANGDSYDHRDSTFSAPEPGIQMKDDG